MMYRVAVRECCCLLLIFEVMGRMGWRLLNGQGKILQKVDRNMGRFACGRMIDIKRN